MGSDVLPEAPIGDSSQLSSGDWVIAVGCPQGLDFTVTLGIVSNPQRSATEIGAPQMKGMFIQTDAALNQGNSGGPLVNEKGEVIGINTMVRTNAETIGFAIPINRANQIYDILRTGKKPTHAYFGVEVSTLSPDLANIHNDDPNAGYFFSSNLFRYLFTTEISSSLLNMLVVGHRLPVVYGALVSRVIPTSPAALCGLRKHDIIVEVAGNLVRSAADAEKYLDICKPGIPMRMRVARGEAGSIVDVNVTPENLLTIIQERRKRQPAMSGIKP